ncbi:hypothetical protein B566_EDAN006363 [Ephemera danica]|nr:hypothetical protein B566_EDAN006363 [Ephemera danica]
MSIAKAEEDFNITLAKLVEKYPCLYDYTRKDYNNIALRAAAWQDIAQQLAQDVSDETITVEDCKLRWKSLRGCITRDKKFARQGNKNKKPYYLKDHLEFVKPFTRIATRTSRSSVRLVSSDATVDGDLAEQRPENGTTTETESQTVHVQINRPESLHQLPREAEQSELILQANTSDMRLRAAGREHEDNIAVPAVHPPPMPAEDENPDLIFFKSLLPDLSRMNPRQRSTFRLGVVSLIDQVLYGSTETQFSDTATPSCSTVVSWTN